MADLAIGERFDQRGPLAGACPLDRLLCRFPNGHHVVAVHADAGKPVRGRLLAMFVFRVAMESGVAVA